MNNYFNFNRFWLLVRRQWAENKILYIIIWGVISCGMVFFGLFPDKINNGGYLLIYGLTAAVITFITFPRWSDFGRSAGYMLIPASLAEKFLCGLFFSMILFTGVYCLTYFIMRYIVTYLIVFLFFSNNLVPFHDFMKEAINEITLFPLRTYLVFFLMFMFIQSICLICVIRFKKNQLLIFFLIFFAVIIIYNIGMTKLMSDLVPHKGIIVKIPGALFTFLSPDFGYYKNVNIQNITEYFSFTKLIGNLNRWIWFAVFAMLYLSAWFRLKEREL